MQGLHLTADLYDCQCAAALMTAVEDLRQHCLDAVSAAGLQAVAHEFHTFPATQAGPGGVTGAVLLAESHLCLHTWPELRAVTFDVYVCNFGGDRSASAKMLFERMVALFAPTRIERNSFARGTASSPVCIDAYLAASGSAYR